MAIICGTFSHVAKVGTVGEIGPAINRPEINLSYAPLPISVDAQAYIDGLILGEKGEFSHLPYHRSSYNISLYRNLAFIRGNDPSELEPDVLYTRMTEFPDRPGKYGFVLALSAGLKTYWNAQNGSLPIMASLMEKQPCEDPFFHLDGMEDGRNMRGLATFTGKCSTRFIDNDQAQILERGDLGFKGVLGSVSSLEETIEVGSVPIGALSIHKGLILKTIPRFNISNGVVSYSEVVSDPLEYQNPLGHAEPSAKDCQGEARLQFMIDQVPRAPSI